jgi:hypothetical protein
MKPKGITWGEAFQIAFWILSIIGLVGMVIPPLFATLCALSFAQVAMMLVGLTGLVKTFL